jgi:NADPH:quinone reductase-like Zn-dependent oxidoreductase
VERALIVDGDLLAPKPKDVPWEEAAAFPLPALTAAQALREVITPDADRLVLVNGAGGVTGGLTAALAWLWGARVIATAGPASAAAPIGSVWRLCTTTAIATGRRLCVP